MTKLLSQATRDDDTSSAERLREELAALGGLKRYQDASLSGQRRERGGDTGSVLVQWLLEAAEAATASASASEDSNDRDRGQDGSHRSSGPAPTERRWRGLRMLEVGALSVDGACARSGLFSGDQNTETKTRAETPRLAAATEDKTQPSLDGGIKRIDLCSRHPRIKEVNFMDLEPPSITNTPRSASASALEKGFDIVSLSLVLNFVGDAAERGRMLRRVGRFLRSTSSDIDLDDTRNDTPPNRFKTQNKHFTKDRKKGSESASHESSSSLLPALFLVLPAPCVTNSRYMDEFRLEGIMHTLGYHLVRRKMSPKLVYYLWRYRGSTTTTSSVEQEGQGQEQEQHGFDKKTEIRKGRDRNNFAVILK